MKDVGTKFTGEYEKTGHAEVTDDDLVLLDEADKINSVIIHPRNNPDKTLPKIASMYGASRTADITVATNTDKTLLTLAHEDKRPDSDYDPEQLKKGIAEEMEHTDYPAVAKVVAKDHIDKDKNAYLKKEENMGTAASGNWGHAGRPGERGGSVSPGGPNSGTQGTSAGKSPKSGGNAPVGDVTLDTHDTSKMSYMQEKEIADSIRAEMPPKEDWSNPRGHEIADMALAGFGGRGSFLTVARNEDGEFEGLAKYFLWAPPFAPESPKIKIQFIASVGDMKHVGTDMLSKIIEKNPGRAVELEADSGAKGFYRHIGMTEDKDFGDGKEGLYSWTAKEAAAFADKPRAHINIGKPGSGNFNHEGREKLVGGAKARIGGRKLDPKKVANGKKTHVPQDPVKLAHATANEQIIADQIPRSIHTPDHEPFDVLSKPYAIEVKTICPGAKNPKITMHNDDERQSLSRKWAEAEKNNLDPWTVAIDARAGYDKPVYYIKHGLGSFNLSAMTKTTLAEIKGVFA